MLFLGRVGAECGVIETLLEVLGDPDEGLELRDDFAAELRRSLAAVEAGEKTAPVQEIECRAAFTSVSLGGVSGVKGIEHWEGFSGGGAGETNEPPRARV